MSRLEYILYISYFAIETSQFNIKKKKMYCFFTNLIKIFINTCFFFHDKRTNHAWLLQLYDIHYFIQFYIDIINDTFTVTYLREGHEPI